MDFLEILCANGCNGLDFKFLFGCRSAYATLDQGGPKTIEC